ncbi:formyl peptide receptor 2-like [Mixophyes fleayi]|uniref:formyl peptide receptor 2-like n=1 Tax=Mixophyes fleayi TaxID=3061075 RepID=UPI003F4E4263
MSTPSVDNWTLYKSTVDYDLETPVMPISSLDNWTLYNSTADYEEFSTTSDYDTYYWETLDIIRIFSIIWYSVVLILGIIGNGLVIWIAGYKMKTVSAVWYLHLAIADFVTCISLPLRISEWALFWVITYDHFLCKAGITVLFINMLSSVYFMTVISIDRCVSIFWPVWTNIHRTPRLATIIALCVWLLCLITSIPHVVFNHGFEWVTECYPKYSDFFDSDEEKKRFAMFITRNVCMFAFPFTIILISYVLVFCKLRAMRKPNRSHRPFKIITGVIVCFFLCWFPYNTWPLITLHRKFRTIDAVITESTVCLAYFSSCINPLLYVFFCHDFKKSFLRSIPAALEKVFNERSDLNCMDSATNTITIVNLNSSCLSRLKNT